MHVISRYKVFSKGLRSRVTPKVKEELQKKLVAFSFPHTGEHPASSLFDTSFQNYFLEVGCGQGEFLLEASKQRPQDGFIGCDPFLRGVFKIYKTIENEKRNNIRIYANNAIELLDILQENSLHGVYVLCPDPWPKKKHHKRRVIQKNFLLLLERILVHNGKILIASDIEEYMHWSLEIFHQRNQEMKECSWILHQDKQGNSIFPYSEELPKTSFMKKGILAGRNILSLEVTLQKA